MALGLLAGAMAGSVIAPIKDRRKGRYSVRRTKRIIALPMLKQLLALSLNSWVSADLLARAHWQC